MAIGVTHHHRSLPMTFTGVAATDSATVAAAINHVSSQDGGLIATVGATGIDLSSTATRPPRSPLPNGPCG